MGSTCFMNSVLQVLCHNRCFTSSPQLSFHFRACPITNKPPTQTSSDATTSSSSSSQLTTCIPCEFFKVYKDLRFQNQNDNAVIPSSLLYAIWNLIDYMVGYAQQDAHEFLLALLNGIECQIAVENIPYIGPQLDKLYGGELQSTLTCQNCHDVSKTTQNFVDINLSLEGNSLSDDAVRLEDCLGVFTMEEILSDTMICEKCGGKQTKSKQLKILKAPTLLIIHLKRFDFMKNKKILKTVIFSPTSLNLSQFCVDQEKPVEYESVGVICHEGTLNQGHYISFVKEGSTWLRCDDESVTIATDSDVMKSEAYILFYQRKS